MPDKIIQPGDPVVPNNALAWIAVNPRDTREIGNQTKPEDVEPTT